MTRSRSTVSPRSPLGPVKLGSWLTISVGLWEAVSPFILGYSGAPMQNDIVSGISISIFAVIRYYAPFETAALSWVNAILGIQLVTVPSILILSGVAMLNDIIVGTAVAALSIWVATARHAY